MPVFEASGRELGWMIFELNEAYVVGKVLPQLTSEYLNPIKPVHDVSVSRATADAKVIFSTREDHGGVIQGADATAGLFSFQVGECRDEGGGTFARRLTHPGELSPSGIGPVHWTRRSRLPAGGILSLH